MMKSNIEKDVERSMQLKQERVKEEELRRAKSAAENVFRQGTTGYELQKNVKDCQIIIPKDAEVIYSPEKKLRQKQAHMSSKVSSFIEVTSSHS